MSSKPQATPEDIAVGAWLSAALDDKMVCQEMKDDINKWMESKNWESMKTWPETTGQLEIKWEKEIERNENDR